MIVPSKDLTKENIKIFINRDKDNNQELNVTLEKPVVMVLAETILSLQVFFEGIFVGVSTVQKSLEKPANPLGKHAKEIPKNVRIINFNGLLLR